MRTVWELELDAGSSHTKDIRNVIFLLSTRVKQTVIPDDRDKTIALSMLAQLLRPKG